MLNLGVEAPYMNERVLKILKITPKSKDFKKPVKMTFSAYLLQKTVMRGIVGTYIITGG